MSFRLLPPEGRPTISKDPDASLRYGIDVAGLLQSGDTISTVAAAGNGVTVGAAAYSGTVVSVRVSGGTAGQTGDVTLTWTTAQGDTDQRTLYFAIAQR